MFILCDTCQKQEQLRICVKLKWFKQFSCDFKLVCFQTCCNLGAFPPNVLSTTFGNEKEIAFLTLGIGYWKLRCRVAGLFCRQSAKKAINKLSDRKFPLKAVNCNTVSKGSNLNMGSGKLVIFFGGIRSRRMLISGDKEECAEGSKL